MSAPAGVHWLIYLVIIIVVAVIVIIVIRELLGAILIGQPILQNSEYEINQIKDLLPLVKQ